MYDNREKVKFLMAALAAGFGAYPICGRKQIGNLAEGSSAMRVGRRQDGFLREAKCRIHSPVLPL